jgi:hypothetical protein
MGFARGFIKGFVSQAIDTKVAEDQRLADFNEKIANLYIDEKRPAFIENEKMLKNRYDTVSAIDKSLAKYGLANNLYNTEEGYRALLKVDNNFIKKVKELDLSGVNFETGAKERTMRFNEKWKPTTDNLIKNQFGKNTIDLTVPIPGGDMQRDDIQSSTFDASSVPSMFDLSSAKSFNDFTALPINEKRQLRSDARSEFDALARDKNTKRFKKSFAEGYNSKIHGPSEDEYAFNNYFRNNYLPKVYNIPFKSPGRFEEDSRVNLAQDAINRARAAGDEEAVEAIKQQLRTDLGISNLGELIK